MRTLGFGRVFSGRITRGQEIFVIGAKTKKVLNENGETIEVRDISKTKIDNVYLFNAQYP